MDSAPLALLTNVRFKYTSYFNQIETVDATGALVNQFKPILVFLVLRLPSDFTFNASQFSLSQYTISNLFSVPGAVLFATPIGEGCKEFRMPNLHLSRGESLYTAIVCKG